MASPFHILSAPSIRFVSMVTTSPQRTISGFSPTHERIIIILVVIDIIVVIVVVNRTRRVPYMVMNDDVCIIGE